MSKANLGKKPAAGAAKYGSAVADGLIEGMQEFVAGLRAGKLNAKVTTVEVAIPAMTTADVKAVRDSLGLSQPLFADLIGASAGTVKAWEQGKTVPPMARRLLGTILENPEYWKEQVAKAIKAK